MDPFPKAESSFCESQIEARFQCSKLYTRGRSTRGFGFKHGTTRTHVILMQTLQVIHKAAVPGDFHLYNTLSVCAADTSLPSFGNKNPTHFSQLGSYMQW